MNLKDMGWNPLNSEEEISSEQLARIICVHKGSCSAVSADGPLSVHLSGRFHFEMNCAADRPATGDFIKISPPFIDERGQRAAVLTEILPRRSKISRLAPGGGGTVEQVLVANLDVAFIVTSANEDFSVNRLQRYVLLAREGGVSPVILLSKIDLVERLDELLSSVRNRVEGVEVLPVSSYSGAGIDKVREILVSGTTSAFLGSSGVGKSSIVNKLLGEEVQLTKEVRSEDAKGRHATTSRELFFVPGGGMIIDTAGLREVQVLAGQDAVDSTFHMVVDLMEKCRFSNCSHGSEPGCAVKEAIQSGSLPEEEYQSYLKLQREAAFAERKVNKALASNSKERWKKVHKDYKARKKFEGRD